MRHILAPANVSALADFAGSNVVVALDYDGTLAPIVATPARAVMRGRTRRLLAAAARRYPCVVISGRAAADVSARLQGIPIWHVSGNHGVEPWSAHARYVRHVADWIERLRPRLAAHAGVQIEDKRYSVTIHYRRAVRPRAARAAIARAVRRLPDVQVLGGKAAVNLVPRGAPTKGSALEHARRLLVCDRAIYVGDDITDEDVFRADSNRVLGIRVGLSRRSRAPYGLRNQGEIDGLLAALVAMRPLSHARRR